VGKQFLSTDQSILVTTNYDSKLSLIVCKSQSVPKGPSWGDWAPVGGADVLHFLGRMGTDPFAASSLFKRLDGGAVNTTDRLNSLLSLAKQDPESAFVRYGLAMEYSRLDMTEEALQSFRQLVEKDPLYVAAYYQMGTLLVRLGEIEEAKQTYSQGIKAAVQKSDWHAKSELEAALESL